MVRTYRVVFTTSSGDTGCSRISATVNNAAGNTGERASLQTNVFKQVGRKRTRVIWFHSDAGREKGNKLIDPENRKVVTREARGGQRVQRARGVEFKVTGRG